MNARFKLTLLTSLLVVAFLCASTVGTQALKLGDIVKVGGIAYIVDTFGDQINDFVNKLTANKNVSTTQATKVVPIISFGGGGYIGASQIIAATNNVDK